MAPEPAEPAEAARCNNHFIDKPILGAKLNLLSVRFNKARLFTMGRTGFTNKQSISKREKT